MITTLFLNRLPIWVPLWLSRSHDLQDRGRLVPVGTGGDVDERQPANERGGLARERDRGEPPEGHADHQLGLRGERVDGDGDVGGAEARSERALGSVVGVAVPGE